MYFMQDPRSALRDSHDRNLEDLFALLRHPSISALPDHRDDVRQTAEALADLMRSYGIEHVRVHETAGHPIVYGDYLHAPGRPTALVYGHYDV
ncbi:peptidase, M20/M25/M40 family protein, partial [mine drainage metagenome]